MTRRDRPQPGFTLVEMLLAVVIASVALTGVYGLLRTALEIERRMHTTWTGRSAAESVVSEIATSVRNAAPAGERPAITGEPAEGGGWRMTCLTFRGGASKLCRYRWRPPGGAERQTDQPGMLHRQVRRFAGSQDLSEASRQADRTEQQRWARVPLELTARGLDELEISFAKLKHDGLAGWSNAWDKQEPVGVRIRAVSGEQEVQRIALQRAVSTEDDQ